MRPHGLGWAEAVEHGAMGVSHRVECVCGAVWERARLADAAIALERHEHAPRTWPGDDVEAAPAASSLPTGNRRRTVAGQSLPSEAAEAERDLVRRGESMR